MTEIAWTDGRDCAIKEQGRKVLTHPTASKANVPEKEVTHMPFAAIIPFALCTSMRTFANGGAL